MSEQSANEELTLQVFGLAQDSIVDGPGLRFVVFVQGCTHHCLGCHNPESQSKEGGTTYSLDDLYDKIRANGLVHAVTFSGGEPFEQPEACAELAARLKEDGYNLWAYSGYMLEDLLKMGEDDAAIKRFLENIDVLVDGPYIESLHSYDAKWRGSTNQRIIDVPATLAEGTVVIAID